ncbi:MAG: PTS transporter subunit EIIC [Erysipelotrichaceae bacterium]|nr:PTS transporter subunit EIIC [Erysipelotrichaceae bacterium]
MNFLQKIAESRFMRGLENLSMKLSGSPAFSALSNGMGGSMGIIMIGAVVQIICVLGTTFFGMDPQGEIYNTLYTPYRLTMGCLALFLAFNLANAYAKNLKMNGITSGICSIVCFLLVACPLQTATVGDKVITAINLDNLGSSSMFVAMIIGFISVRISKFAIDHKWIIRMPDAVPEGILNSFNSIIPTGLNVFFWYGLAVLISTLTGGTMTLASMITAILAVPVGYLTSIPGILLVIIIQQFLWFFGIHGTGVIMNALMVPYVSAYMTNAELAATGQPLVFNAIFLLGAASIIGGTGNTLPLVTLGLRSKSKQIRSISKASLVPNLFNINEPVVFGMPIMYNPVLFIPYLLNPIIIALIMCLGYTTGILALPQVLIMTALPILVTPFMSTLSWRNVVFSALCFPLVFIIWYPFFKIYEKQCIEKEAEDIESIEVENYARE